MNLMIQMLSWRRKNINDIKILKCMRYVFICFQLVCSLSFTLNFYFPSFYVWMLLCFLKYIIVDILSIRELRVMLGEGPYDHPPSRGWPCLVENILFLKQREAHLCLYHHFQFWIWFIKQMYQEICATGELGHDMMVGQMCKVMSTHDCPWNEFPPGCLIMIFRKLTKLMFRC